MKAALLPFLGIISAHGFFGRGPKVDPCRCEGRWVMDIPSWQEAATPTATLRNVAHPIAVDVWHSENNDPRSVRLTIKSANTITTVVTATGKDFCSNDVTLTSGMVSTRMFAVGAAAFNEKAIVTKLLNNLDYWSCDLKRGRLTLQSPDARVSLIKYKPEPPVEDDMPVVEIASVPESIVMPTV